LLVDTVLFNAKVYAAKRIVDAGIAIDNKRIVKIAKETSLPKASARLNMNGCFVLPGLIDSHVHLRDQELAYREDFTTGTAAAAAGGVTTVIDMPNNQPLTMDSRSLRERMQVAEKRILVNVAFNSAFPRGTNEVNRIVREGAVGFKLYLLQQIGGISIDDDNALRHAFKAIAETGVPIAVHAEDKAMLEAIKKKMQSAGRNGAEAFLEAHPLEAEVKAIQHVVELAKNSGARVHICHVSSAAGLKTVQKARQRDLKITCEITPHHLLLTSQNLKKEGNLALTIPPLRSKADTGEAFWKALKQGSVDTIASDHAPHSIEEKTAQSIWDVKPGISGLETMLPLMLTEVNRNHLTIPELIRLTSERPAELFRIEGRGKISEGCYADVVVVDMNREYKIDASKFHSKAKFSPFDGWKVKGKPVKTFVNGQLMMDEGEIVAKPGTGQILR